MEPCPSPQQVRHFKWSDGKEYERSRRLKRVQAEQDQETKQYLREVESSAYSSSLYHDENTWDILNQLQGFQRKTSSKREDMDSKLANRDMVRQIGFNPFLGQSNYVDDIQVSSQYLTPQCTQTLDY